MHDTPSRDGWDREAFLRVWRRVSPVDRPDSPIVIYDVPPEPAPTLPEPLLPVAQRPGYAELIARELACAQCLRALARRTGRGGGRTLSALAAGAERRARVLAAEAFLRTGTRHWYSERPRPGIPAPHPAHALRGCYLVAQAAAARYAALAAAVEDAGLAALCRAHERETQDLMQVLRRLVQRYL